ncbi:MAG: hypothetical protein OJF49_003409 [Ktedonobacterales bacterium]|jgi:hypothetical protein|nr:MAG: hypothetical protein OJF49_003409 [Ktedonobacterales bacterium]
MQSNRVLGLAVGVVLGIVWAWLGFGAVLLVAALGAVGWLIGGIATGEVDVVSIWEGLRGGSGA